MNIGATVSINCIVCSIDATFPHASTAVKTRTMLEVGDMHPPDPKLSMYVSSETSLQESNASASSKTSSEHAISK